jgi:hypothetical protein
MRGLMPKKSTENGEECLHRLGKMKHIHDILVGETKLCVTCTSREFGIPVDGGSRISVILPVH